MADPFRDGAAAQLELLRSLDAQVAELEARLSPTFWRRVAETLGLEPPAAGAPLAADAPPEAVALRVAEREARLAALGRAHAEIGRLEAAFHAPAPGFPAITFEATNPSFTGWEASPDDRGIAAFRRAAAGLAPGAALQEVWKGGYGGVVTFATPLGPCQASMDKYKRQSEVRQKVVVRGTASRLHGELTVRPEGFIDPLLAKLGLKQDIQIGQEELDGLFLVQGDDDVARALLTDRARGALLTLIVQVRPELVVADGMVTVSWDGPVGPDVIGTALTLVDELRSAPPTRPLLAT